MLTEDERESRDSTPFGDGGLREQQPVPEPTQTHTAARPREQTPAGPSRSLEPSTGTKLGRRSAHVFASQGQLPFIVFWSMS